VGVEVQKPDSQMPDKYRVIIRRCPDYQDLDLMRNIVSEGIEELELSPSGKILLKPNLVSANKKYSRYAYTHPRVTEAIIDVLASRKEVESITIGERTGLNFPTRLSFSMAGYGYLRKKPKVSACFFDEDRLVDVSFKKGSFHKTLRLSRTLIDADFKIYAPKLKHHVSTRITCSMKLNLGICDSKERLDGHAFQLEEKIADLYEVGCPDLVVVDAVDVGQQSEIVPKPLRLGVIIMGTSGVAVDSVAALLLGFDSTEIIHLNIARSRGWTPVYDEQIEIKSEVPWNELVTKTKDFDCTYSDLKKINTPIRFFLGSYPNGNDLCHGGCLNMLKGALAIHEAYSPGALAQARPVAIVNGEYEGDVDGQGYPILLIGNCTKINGNVIGKRHRIKGCPVTIPMFTIRVPFYLRIPAPLFDLSLHQLISYVYHYIVSLIIKFIHRVLKL